MLILNGLRIATADGDEAAEPADVLWRTQRVDSLPAEPGAGDPIAIVREAPGGSGSATDHIFGYGGRVRCRFRIGPDGSAISCRAIPEVSDRDLFSLFAEPVMRTILVRRGLLSFHAAALARNGRSILIMADKGAGKSTLSWALQSRGWQLLADDLARVDSVEGRWSAFPGHRQTKLTPEAARAFGQSAEAMPVRFDDPGPAEYAAFFDKRVIDPAEALADPSVAVPLATLCFLTARDPVAAGPRIEPLSQSATVRRLIEHATPDPLGRTMLVPAWLQRAVGGLTSHVKAVSLTLPDDFDRLDEAAEALEPLAADSKSSA
ncbi:MAG TPA: hypothetical protein VE891_01735 [Allosphingosinicella sp.]|nr:hypothetical protein [Allosphingosinicella sp.]